MYKYRFFNVASFENTLYEILNNLPSISYSDFEAIFTTY